nr:helix-turn-helix transcriptional regulator [Bittarella massiliensis (ex Durand et al. 2017)]
MGLKIAYYRKRAGYTQEAFAEKIGRSNNFVSQVEGVGTTKGVSLETLFKMADVLGVAVNELLKD